MKKKGMISIAYQKISIKTKLLARTIFENLKLILKI